MGEGRGKTISMNDEIPPVYMSQKGIKNKSARNTRTLCSEIN